MVAKPVHDSWLSEPSANTKNTHNTTNNTTTNNNNNNNNRNRNTNDNASGLLLAPSQRLARHRRAAGLETVMPSEPRLDP